MRRIVWPCRSQAKWPRAPRCLPGSGALDPAPTGPNPDPGMNCAVAAKMGLEWAVGPHNLRLAGQINSVLSEVKVTWLDLNLMMSRFGSESHWESPREGCCRLASLVERPTHGVSLFSALRDGCRSITTSKSRSIFLPTIKFSPASRGRVYLSLVTRVVCLSRGKLLCRCQRHTPGVSSKLLSSTFRTTILPLHTRELLTA